MPTRLPRGILIAFEGIDGAGKTTQLGLLGDALRGMDLDVVLSKEPTAGKWGQRLRDSAQTGRLSAQDELAAFIEDRREHVTTLIAPALRDGKVVLLDRYYLSTVAYQGARGFAPADVLAMNESFAPAPDLLFLLEVPPALGLQRIAARGSVANSFELESTLAQCAAIFGAIDRPFIRRLDGTRSIQEVAGLVLSAVREGPLRQLET